MSQINLKRKRLALLIKVEGIAQLTAERFVEEIPAFVKFVTEANLEYKLEVGSSSKASNVETDKAHPLDGKKIVFTGGKDKGLIEKLKKVGAQIGTSVSKNTFVVIAKTHDEDTGKADAARALNIPIMTVTEFEAKYL